MQTQIVGIILSVIGFLGTIVICALPMWKMSAFIAANIVTAQVFWEGIWMNCVIQSTGHAQCKAYDSLLALPRSLQAARGLVCASIGVSVVAIGLTVVGAKSFVHHTCELVSTHHYNWILRPHDHRGAQRELGACIYVGWASGALLVIGGGVLCSTYGC
ncbi:hypothetical protein WMY93_030907 [Mugilogobius chulae]|uniref:Claudin n=1 Tax=Mugilogobius chulae TaxID=88201 RepID=A0AAW0MNS0_9GOBI